MAELARLTSDISEHPEQEAEHAKVFGKDFVSAALNLGRVFRSKQLFDSCSTIPSSPHPQTSSSKLIHPSAPLQLQVPNHLTRSSENTFQLPKLPVIRDESLADLPFTHQGVLQAHQRETVNLSYDRLELLGDAYIELFATRLIFPRFPRLPAGRLSQIRESLVKNETLAEFSLAYGFDKRAHLPSSIKNAGQTGSKIWTKTLGDIFEAYVAAVVISDLIEGFATAETWLTELWIPKLPEEDIINPNSKLNLSQKIMGKNIKISYREERPQETIKKEGKIWYHIGAYLTGWGWEDQHLGSGKGLNKVLAGNQAAAQALLNPLTDQIAAVKRDFDAKVKAQRELQSSNVAGK